MTIRTFNKDIKEHRFRRQKGIRKDKTPTSTEANRRGPTNAPGSPTGEADDLELRFAANALESRMFDALDDEERMIKLRAVATETFQITRTLAWPGEPVAAAQWLVRPGRIAVVGDRSVDFRRIVMERELPGRPPDSRDQGLWTFDSTNPCRKFLDIGDSQARGIPIPTNQTEIHPTQQTEV